MDDTREIVDNFISELRRGTLVLSVLSQLIKPRYGYSLVETMENKGTPIEPGTLYPLLRRLEKQGLLESQWQTSGTKPRKYYVLSDKGREVFQLLCREWDEMIAGVNGLIQEGSEEK